MTTALVLERFVPPRALVLERIGPDASVTAIAQAYQASFPMQFGPPGPAGAGAGFKAAFSYGDATPDLIGMLSPGAVIDATEVLIDVALNGVGATISVGTLADPELLMPTTGNLPSATGGYSSGQSPVISVATDIYLFINPGAGASTGSGRVLLSAK